MGEKALCHSFFVFCCKLIMLNRANGHTTCLQMRSVLIFLFSVIAVIGHAQDSTRLRELDEVIVTGSRLEQPLTEVPRQVTVITREEMDRSAFTSVADLLARQSGLYLVGANQAAGVNQSLFLRGAASNQVLVMVDGIRLTDPSTPNNVIDLSELSLADVERIEILRGGHSSAYGSAAIGGVVNIITRTRQDEGFHGQVVLQGGHLGPRGTTFQQQAEAGYQSSNGWFVRGALWNQNVDGFNATLDTVTNRFKPADNDDFRKTDGRLVAGFQSDRLDVSLAYKRTDQRADIDAGAYTDDDNSYLDFGRNWWQGTVHYTLNPKSKLSYLGSYSSSIRFTENDSSEISPDSFDGNYFRGSYAGNLLTQEVQITFTPDEKISVVGGGGVFRERMNFNTFFFSSQFGGFQLVTDYDTIRQEAYTTYAFARANWALSKRVTLQGGARATHHSLFGRLFTADAGAVYAVDRLSFFATASTGFNVPSLSQLYDPTRGFGAVTSRGNPSLQPERSAGVEVGMRYAGPGRTHVSLSGFYNSTRQSIEYVYLWNNSTPIDQLTFLDYQGDTYLNVSRQRNLGMEARGGFQLAPWFWVEGNLTWMTNRFEAAPGDLPNSFVSPSHVQLVGNGAFLSAEVRQADLPRRPSFMARAQANAQWGKWLLQMRYRYDGGRPDVAYDPSSGPFGALGRLPVGAYQLADASVLFNLSARFSLNLTVENLFNLNYQEIAGFVTRGRSGYLKILGRF